MQFKPLEDRVLIERIESAEKTKGGILIPDTAKEKPVEGLVIAAGMGRYDHHGKLVPMSVKIGDKVLFGKWSGTEVTLEEKDYIIMKESDILGIL